MKLKLPPVFSGTESEQLRQVRSYLYETVKELEYALGQLEGKEQTAAQPVQQPSGVSAAEKAQQNFSQIKSLIIKSADIVNAYYDEINSRLEGVYVAESDFGVYAEQTSQQINANSTAIEQQYENIQQILSDVETVVKINAHIKAGILYYEKDVAVYGLEIGQRNVIDGVEVFNKYARFTADKLSFYDSNDNEVAYISDKKLYINHVQVTGSFSLGGFVDTVLEDGSVVTRWAGGA